MEILETFKVYPDIPEELSFLDYLAGNLWFSWNHEAVDLFRRINPGQWERKKRNPVAFLSSISQRQFEKLSMDAGFLDHMKRVQEKFEKMFSKEPDYLNLEIEGRETIAYFSMEFGLHESLPCFAGGLGVLAGDHLKAASALGLPITGIGLLFGQGYFRQFLNHEGWQQEKYFENDIFDMPLQRVKDRFNNDLVIAVTGDEEVIKAAVWQVKVGRVRLLFLDTNLRENSAFARNITSRLYASDPDVRVAQEALLGIGGVRALKALDIFPVVCHLNEGHCSFACMERLSMIMDKYGVDVAAAVEISRRSSVFTTHTPVAAGHDEFYDSGVTPYIRDFTDRFGLSGSEILSWGKPYENKDTELFSMFVLGMHLSGYINGVSRLHGQVARKMWTCAWPKRYPEEIPITHVTNGVHILSYISAQKSALLERYIATDWGEKVSDPEIVARIDEMDDEELWRTHEIERARLVRRCRRLLIHQYGLRNAPRYVMDEVENALDNTTLTICFARRFATYKRADLLLKDPERLLRIINSERRPVQFVFAGKAHPSDNEGKELVQRIVEFARKHEVRHRFVFIEDYDINVARYMVQGCDVWLNTPRRPNEACGTSGMKASANGGLNLSILDGWWCEAYHEKRGWAIASGEVHDDHEYQDMVESQALYNLLENEVVPCFYDRKSGSAPKKWINMMKEAMKMAILEYSSHRMVKDYSDRFYLPASKNLKLLTENDALAARKLASRMKRLDSLWDGVEVENPGVLQYNSFKVGDTFRVTCRVDLGELSPEEVRVQLYYGRLKSNDELHGARTGDMWIQEILGEGAYIFACTVTCEDSGRFGYTVRTVPKGDEVLTATPGLITWAAQS
ncbi:MAG: alpha-glucan family phosphorylase [Desulfobacteraceae bacterium]